MKPEKNNPTESNIQRNNNTPQKSFEELKNSTLIIGGWLPRKMVMDFMEYESTQMAAFEKTPELVVSQIGKRKFITLKSLTEVLEKNIIQQP
jgi:hypothetical protein